MGQIVPEQIADGAVTTAKFAIGIATVKIVTTLPTTGNLADRTICLTTDVKRLLQIWRRADMFPGGDSCAQA